MLNWFIILVAPATWFNRVLKRKRIKNENMFCL